MQKIEIMANLQMKEIDIKKQIQINNISLPRRKIRKKAHPQYLVSILWNKRFLLIHSLDQQTFAIQLLSTFKHKQPNKINENCRHRFLKLIYKMILGEALHNHNYR